MEFNISANENLKHLLNNRWFNRNNDLPFDVKIKVGKDDHVEVFKAHSTILSTRSIYFRNALADKKKESGYFALEKPDISPLMFKAFLKYIYSGKLIVYSPRELFNFITAAINLQFQDVVEHLENYLNENDSAWKLPEDFFTAIEQRQFGKLQERAFKMICMYPEAIFESKHLLTLDEGVLIQLLKRNDLELNEIEIWNYLIKWGIANTDPVALKKDLKKWTPTDFTNLGKTLGNCIPQIRFFQMTFSDYTKVQTKFKGVLPNSLDDEIMQHFRDFNPLIKPPINENILPPRESACSFDSDIINARDAALIASWINNKSGSPYRFKKIPFGLKLKRVHRGSVDGFDNYEIERKICVQDEYFLKNKRKRPPNFRGPLSGIIIVIQVRDSGEIIGAYNPGLNGGFKKPFIYSLTNRANPILSRYKKGAGSRIDREEILFGNSDLSIKGVNCTSELYSYKEKIIDKRNFELAELEIFRIEDTAKYNSVVLSKLLFIYPPDNTSGKSTI